MNFKNIIALSLLMTSFGSVAVDNQNFTKITRMNSWTTVNDIYLEEENTREGNDKKLYKLPKTVQQQFSLVLAAFSANFKVLLSCSCASNGYSEISAVRVKRN